MLAGRSEYRQMATSQRILGVYFDLFPGATPGNTASIFYLYNPHDLLKKICYRIYINCQCFNLHNAILHTGLVTSFNKEPLLKKSTTTSRELFYQKYHNYPLIASIMEFIHKKSQILKIAYNLDVIYSFGNIAVSKPIKHNCLCSLQFIL